MSKIRNMPILVVDDELAIRQYHVASLRTDFENILQADNGLDAWEIFEKTAEIPLVITDIEMPGKDGIWLLNKIRETRPATQIIIVSGLTGNSVSIHSTRGNISYLPKPVAQIYVRLGAKAAYDRYREALWIEKMKQLATAGRNDLSCESVMRCMEEGPWHDHN